MTWLGSAKRLADLTWPARGLLHLGTMRCKLVYAHHGCCNVPLAEQDPSYAHLAVLQVCVPQLMALVLTYPERVTEHNIEKLKQRVLNGGWWKAAPG